jgi:hypothetical protein
LSWIEFNGKGESVTDVFSSRKELVLLQDRKKNVQISGLIEKNVESLDHLKEILESGKSEMVQKSSLLHFSVKNGNNLHGRITFCELFRT